MVVERRGMEGSFLKERMAIGRGVLRVSSSVGKIS